VKRLNTKQEKDLRFICYHLMREAFPAFGNILGTLFRFTPLKNSLSPVEDRTLGSSVQGLRPSFLSQRVSAAFRRLPGHIRDTVNAPHHPFTAPAGPWKRGWSRRGQINLVAKGETSTAARRMRFSGSTGAACVRRQTNWDNSRPQLMDTFPQRISSPCSMLKSGDKYTVILGDPRPSQRRRG